jgi:predicted transcriptional regulator
MLRTDRGITVAHIVRLSGRRRLVKVQASASVVDAMALMRKNNFEQLIIDPIDHERPLVFSGYSVISKLLDTSPSDYAGFLKSPCLLYCLSSGTIGKDSDLPSLLHVFESTTFGYSMVHDETNHICSKVSVADLLPLYGEGLLSSDLAIDDVASAPVFSMSIGSKIVSCMREMESRKFRRVRIASGVSVVSDKEILSYLFNENRLESVSRAPQHLLDGTLEDLDAVHGEWIDGKENISKAASYMSDYRHQFLLTDRGIVTPWDLIIKPWRLGSLKISRLG